MRLLLSFLLALAVSLSAFGAPPCKHEGAGKELLWKPQFRKDACRLVVIDNKVDKRLEVFYDDVMLVQEYSYFALHHTGVLFVVSVTEVNFGVTKKVTPRPKALDPSAPHRYGRREFWWLKDFTFIDVYSDGSGGYWIEVTQVHPPSEKVRHENLAFKALPAETLDPNS